MQKFVWAALASVGLGGWLAAPASAQFGGYQRPYQNPYPAYSPYLNMTGYNNPAINYFGIVRPQMQTTQALQQLQTNQQMLLSNQVGQLPPTATPDGQPPLYFTGHPVGFNDYNRYFPIQGFRTGGAGYGYTGPAAGGIGAFGVRR